MAGADVLSLRKTLDSRTVPEEIIAHLETGGWTGAAQWQAAIPESDLYAYCLESTSLASDGTANSPADTLGPSLREILSLWRGPREEAAPRVPPLSVHVQG